MEAEAILQDYGLTDKEAKVYLSLLQTGISPVNRISNKAQIQRTTTYDVLKSLKEEGLVSFVTKNKKTFFEAVHPSKLISILREKQNKINKILPYLIKIKETAVEKPKVMLYEGKIGLISILEDILKTKKDFLCYTSKNLLLKILEYYFPHFIKRRIKAGIKAKLILNEKPIAQKLTEYRIVNKKFVTATWIYGNKVAILSLTKQEPIGVIVENKEIADTQRIVFDLMWKASAYKIK